jgi:hypothetical protein
VDEASRDSIDCMEVATVAGCARGAGEDSESTAGEGEEGAPLRSDTAGSAEESALTHVGKASADASLPPASVRWGAWLLMLGSAVGRTVRARVCLRVRAVRSRGGQTDRADHESAAHEAGRTPVEWEKACVRSKDRGRRKEPLRSRPTRHAVLAKGSAEQQNALVRIATNSLQCEWMTDAATNAQRVESLAPTV